MDGLGPLALPEYEVHLWFAFPEEIQDQALLTRYHGFLNAEEAQQQARFYFEKHRHQYLVTRAVIRTLLARYDGLAPAEWRFVKNRYGRPAIAPGLGTKRPRFNLSHTDGLIACAVTLDREVGVDVEHMGRGGDLIPIADRFFSPKEVEDLHQVPEQRQIDRFFDYWTLKESYIKARGMGLSIPLEQFSFHIGDHAALDLSVDPRQNDPPSRWQFRQWAVSTDYKAALALEREAGRSFRVIMRSLVPLKEDGEFKRGRELRSNFD